MSSSDRIANRSTRRRSFRLWPAVVMLVISSVAMSTAAPATAAPLGYRVDLKVLVLDDGSSPVGAIKSQMQVEGVPYDAVPIASADITNDFLASGDTAFYQAVVAPSAALTGLLPAEQTALRAYEAKFGVREVDAYNWPDASVGLNAPVWWGDLNGVTATVTSAGKAAGFGYLKGPVPFSVGSWTYVAAPLPTSALPAGAMFTPLVESQPPGGGITGSLLGVYSNAGVEQMVITAAFDFTFPQFKYLGHGIITWMTRGVHFGYNRNNFTLNIDDAFAEDAQWNSEYNCTPAEDCPPGSPATGEPVRMVAADVDYAVAWMAANNYKLTMAFNGFYATNAPSDPLTQSFVAQQSAFRWLNHGSEHIYQGCQQDLSVSPWVCLRDAGSNPLWVSQADIYNEIHQNILKGQQLGLSFTATEYLSGEHSGLQYSSSVTGQAQGDNQNFIAALAQAGIKVAGSDASREDKARVIGSAPTSATTIPRHPTALYYNTSFMPQAVDEYNFIYSLALDPATGFTSYIVPTDAAFDLGFILSNDPRPFFAHASNLTGDRLAYHLLDAILGTYRGVFTEDTPVKNLTLTEAANQLVHQQQWATDSIPVTGYVQNGAISISNSTGRSVPFTAPAGSTINGATLEVYGGELSAWLPSSDSNGTLPAPMLTTTGGVFPVGQNSTMTFSVTGAPTATVAVTGQLPTGLTFNPTPGGGTITGTPAVGTENLYPLSVTIVTAGYNNAEPVTLTVPKAPMITSATSATAVADSPFSFTVVGTGIPPAAITYSGGLPSGVTLSDLGNGTATLAGTPAMAAGGQSFPITLTATNVAGFANQTFTLVVNRAPQVTSSNSATAVADVPFSFTVGTVGTPTPAITMTGSLPAGIAFADLGNGTARLTGTAAMAAVGHSFPLVFIATNSAGVASQSFTLVVDSAPQFTSANSATAVTGTPFTFTVTTTGSPAPTIALSGALPSGLSFAASTDGTMTVSGTATADMASLQFPLTFTATNTAGVVTQQFTLTVHSVPKLTSATSAIAVSGSPFTFTVTATGSPTPTIALTTGPLPSGIAFVTGANGTATLTGTAAMAAVDRSFPLTFTATNSAGVASQSFTLKVTRAPQFTSANSAEVTSGTPFSISVSAVGSPMPSITMSGSLPSGVKFTDLGNGSATISGTAGQASAGKAYAVTFTASNSYGVSTQAFTLTVDADYMALVSLVPARLADTRPGYTTVDGLFAGEGLRARGSTLELVVAGRGGIAADAAAVALNVTVAEPTHSGFVTAYPCGAERPLASNLNFTPGAVLPNAVIAKVGDAGKVCLFVSGDTQLVVDVNGFFPGKSSFHSLNPARVLDTRPETATIDGLQQGEGMRSRGTTTKVQVTGRVTVPSDATTVVLNVTVTEAEGPGFLTVYPCGTDIPTASNINYRTGSTVANMVVAKIGAGGSVCIFNNEATHLVVDVNGYFHGTTAYEPLDPARLLDTRPGLATIDAQFLGDGIPPAGTITELTVTGRGGVPTNAATIMLNVTATEPTMPGFVTVYPCGIDTPLASNLNYGVDTTIAIAAIVQVGSSGKVCLFNSSPTHLVVDVNGFLAG